MSEKTENQYSPNKERAQLNALLKNEQLISSIAYQLHTEDRLDEIIKSVLNKISDSLDISTIFIWQIDPEKKRGSILGGTLPTDNKWKNILDFKFYANLMRKLQEDGILIVHDLNDFDESVREYLHARDIHSFIIIVCNVHESLTSGICFAQKNEYRWHDDRIRLLKLLSDMIASAWRRDFQYKQRMKAENQREEALEVAEKAMRLAAIGEVAGAIAHEINQPLSVIKVTAGDLLFSNHQWINNPEHVRKKLDRIVKSSEKINEAIQHMRSLWANPKDGMTDPISIDRAVKKSLEIISSRIKAHGIKLKVNLMGNDTYINGNPALLDLVIINLITNSIQSLDSIDRSDKKVTIETALKEKKAHILINDNGEGVRQEYRDRIFEPFFTTKSSMDNMGLGLAIVKRYVDTYNGAIFFKNNDNGGVTFEISFPVLDMVGRYDGYTAC